jgi:hypothetical protein
MMGLGCREKKKFDKGCAGAPCFRGDRGDAAFLWMNRVESVIVVECLLVKRFARAVVGALSVDGGEYFPHSSPDLASTKVRKQTSHLPFFFCADPQNTRFHAASLYEAPLLERSHMCTGPPSRGDKHTTHTHTHTHIFGLLAPVPPFCRERYRPRRSRTPKKKQHNAIRDARRTMSNSIATSLAQSHP